VETQARMCTRCGAILWFGDTAKLTTLKAEGEANEKKAAKDAPADEGNG
jgi:RNase P subunit RPR2